MFSPNLAGNDAAIFMAVSDELSAQGHIVQTIHEDEMVAFDYTPYDRVFTMARDIFALVSLEQSTDEDTQAKFINSIRGILTCTNKAAVAADMMESGIPQPEFMIGEKRNILICSTGNKNDICPPVWLKNCDGSATCANDIVFCPTKKDFDTAFQKLEKRNVNLWIVQKHLQGDLVKFYGVEGTDFFHWNYASRGHSKFGLEKVNGKEKGFSFDAKRIKYYADLIAKKINVPIYGGDVIIGEDGQFWLIDFNDFPSFSICTEEAAKYIAKRIIQ